ncbi:MAG: hypothetical protein Q7S56_00980 [Nanoarchaeota archaeon]|nr:hypothetical protein [Nanoarchaeota archaeon]
MKRVVILTILILLVISPVIFAVEIVNSPPDQQTIAGSIGEGLKNGFNNLLENAIIFPTFIDKPLKIIFGINGNEEITSEKIIVLLCILAGLIIFLHSVLEITPFFEGIKAWFGAVIIVLIIGVTGVINSVTIFLFNFANIFKILDTWSALRIAFTLLIIFAIFYGINKLTKIIKENTTISNAEMSGLKAGAEIKKLKTMHEIEK